MTTAAAATTARAAADATAGSTATTAAAGECEAGEPEQTELRLGVIPIADVAPVFIASSGHLRGHGLTVTTEFAAGGAASIPAVVSGDIDLAFGAYPRWSRPSRRASRC